MKPSILPRYLLGHRDAILEIAASPRSIIIGLLFVVSAGLAREYDGEDLLHEPWHLLRPLVASFIAATVLFLLVHLVAVMPREDRGGRPPHFLRAYRMFLGLFWMTAPLAWLYAIPYESFLSPLAAVQANLATLAVVAAWRVLLMTRVVSVIHGIGDVPAFFLVMIVADGVLLIGATMVPVPLLAMMGGISASDQDALMAGLTFDATVLAVLSAPIWLIGAIIATIGVRHWPDLPPPEGRGGARGLLVTALVSVVAFAPLLAVAQPQQVNRRRAETLLRSDRIDEALAEMSERSRDDYPPHWDLPPRLGFREDHPQLEAVHAAMERRWPAPWVAEAYLGKTHAALRMTLRAFGLEQSWVELIERFDPDRLAELSDGKAGRAARFIVEHDSSLSDGDRSALLELANAAHVDEPGTDAGAGAGTGTGTGAGAGADADADADTGTAPDEGRPSHTPS